MLRLAFVGAGLGLERCCFVADGRRAQDCRLSSRRRHRRAAARRRRRPYAPAPAPQDPLGIALQQKLSAPAKRRADDADAQDRAALATFYADARLRAAVGRPAAASTPRPWRSSPRSARPTTGASMPRDFALPVAAAGAGAAPSADALAEAEITLSLAVLKYARYARGGRIIDPATQLSSYLDRKPQLLDPKDVLDEDRRGRASPTPTCAGCIPSIRSSRSCARSTSRCAQAAAATAIVQLPDGPQLMPGKSDPQVALLRKRLEGRRCRRRPTSRPMRPSTTTR